MRAAPRVPLLLDLSEYGFLECRRELPKLPDGGVVGARFTADVGVF